jgi:hypothetical protein
MTDVVREAQERCSGDANYREWFKQPSGEMAMKEVIVRGRPWWTPYTMRKTPYTDSEGKPIYEGDIVQVHGDENWDGICFVAWDDQCGWALLSGEDHDYAGSVHRADEATVVGNVFEDAQLLEEHPELLEVTV